MYDQHALLELLLRSERTTGAWVIVNHHSYPLETRWATNFEGLAGEILGKYIFPRNDTYPLLGRRGPESHPRVAGDPGTGICAAVRLLTLKTREVTCASSNTSVREKNWTKMSLHFSLASSFFFGHFCSEAALGEPSQPHPVSYRF